MMKKTFLIFIVVAAFAIAGCTPKGSGITASKMNKCFDGAPAWVLNGGAEGGLSAVGSAQVGNAGISFAKTEALANGRDEIARILELKVSNMVKNFTQTTGVGNSQTVDKVSSTVSRQLASQTITSSKLKSQWLSSECNELFVLVVADAPGIKKDIKDQITSSYRNEEAIWQQIQAKDALKEMDREIDKVMNTPNNQLDGY